MQVLASSDPLSLPSDAAGVIGVVYDPAPTVRLPSQAVFDPTIHLCHKPPSKTYTFEELGLNKKGICPTAISEVRFKSCLIAIRRHQC